MAAKAPHLSQSPSFPFLSTSIRHYLVFIMSLLRLPPEILIQIFDEASSSFFREDLGRLTVCRQWLEFALPTTFKNIVFSQETLRGLLASHIQQSEADRRGRS